MKRLSRLGKLALAVVLVALLVGGCARDPEPNGPKKSLSQLATDLKLITAAGYSRVCLFDLKSIRDYADPSYTALLKKYADSGLEITVYVQHMQPDQETLEFARSVGASAVIVYEKGLLTLFQQAGFRTLWWASVAYPHEHPDQPQYMDWVDLRSDQVRQDLARWAVDVPPEVNGGLLLDYIRWNDVGEGRTAGQVTDLVKRIRTNWNATERGPLSAAVYAYLGNSPRRGGALAVGQEWNEWLNEKLIDLAYPMAYDSADIPALVQAWKSYDRTRIIPCLSVMNYNRVGKSPK